MCVITVMIQFMYGVFSSVLYYFCDGIWLYFNLVNGYCFNYLIVGMGVNFLFHIEYHELQFDNIGNALIFVHVCHIGIFR